MERSTRRRYQPSRRIDARARSADAMEFFNVLTSQALLEMVEALSPQHRKRLYTPVATLSMFMQQALDADGSRQKVVDGWAQQRSGCGLAPYSTRTGGYCRVLLTVKNPDNWTVTITCLQVFSHCDAVLADIGQRIGVKGLLRRVFARPRLSSRSAKLVARGSHAVKWSPLLVINTAPFRSGE